jgi:hypothetical protein
LRTIHRSAQSFTSTPIAATRRILLVAAVLLASPTLRSQTSNAVFLQGAIHAADGTVVPRAHIDLLFVPTGALQRVQADDDGRYLIAGARVGGPYTLRVSHVGYATETRTGIMLRSFESARVDIILQQVNLLEDEVIVKGTRLESQSKDASGVTLHVDRERLEALPHTSGSLEDAERLSPYMAGQSALGFNRMYNDVSRDGIGIGDQFGLQRSETVPGGMQASPIAMESIEEVQVDLSPFDVQRSGFTGAAISAMTRSGSNVTAGSLYGQAAGGWWVGRNPDDGRKDLRGLADQRAGFRIGGPVVESDAFYFVTGEVSRVRVPIERRFDASSTGATMFSFSPAAITQFVTFLDTAYGYDPGRMDIVSLQRESANLFARFDVNLSPGHRLSLSYNMVTSRSDRPPYETSVFSGGTLARNANTVHSVLLSLNSLIGGASANELLLGFTSRRYTSTPQGVAFPFVDVIEMDRLQWWNHLAVGSEIGGSGHSSVEDHLQLRNSTTFNLGSHLLTGGIQGDLHFFRSALLAEQWGRYEFASRFDFMRGQPSEYEYRYARIPGGEMGPQWRALQFGMFLQDEWTLSSVVSFTVGIRLDLPLFPDRPSNNAMVHDAFEKFGYDLSTTRLPGSHPMFSPRIGFTLDPKPDHTIRVRGGVGVFTGRVPYSWIGNLYDHTGLGYIHIKESANAPGFVADPSAQPVPGSGNRLRETMEIVTLSSDFVLPQEVRWTLACDLVFPHQIVVSLESVFSRTVNGVVFRNINLKPTGHLTSVGLDIVTEGSRDQREIFGMNLPGARWDYSRVDDRFTDVMVMANTSEGTTTFHTIQIQRRPEGNGLFASLAYSMGSTQDINSGVWDNAYDQWRYNPAVRPNEPALSPSAFDRAHRIVAAVSYQYEWFPGFAATFGLTYSGISGTPYSYVYEGDVNGDGESLNDLCFIPGQYTDIILTDGGVSQLLYTDPAYNQLFKFITEDEYLSTHRRQIAERNGARTPWNHQVDLRLAQSLPVFGGNKLEISAELLNVLNLLRESWGHVVVVPNQVVPLLKFYTLDGAGRPWFQWAPRTSPVLPEPLLSRWRLRLGLRYSF